MGPQQPALAGGSQGSGGNGASPPAFFQVSSGVTFAWGVEGQVSGKWSSERFSYLPEATRVSDGRAGRESQSPCHFMSLYLLTALSYFPKRN